MKAALIDLDGTLADSLNSLYHAYERFLGKFSIVATNEEFTELMGPTLPEVVAILREKHGLKETEKKLLEIYEETLEALYANEIRPLPGAEEMLKRFKEQGLQIAVVTSAKRILAEQFLKKNQLDHYVDAIISGEGVQEGKPSPEIYLKALKELGITAKDAIAIEDSPAGFASAEGAGIKTVLPLFENS